MILMSENSRYTLVDFVYAAISPVLIMALVGSLAFFVIEVCYEGVYLGKVQWILFFYVFGSVLVSRIAMTGYLRGRAPIYGLVLAGATYLALLMYVDYSQTLLRGLSGLVNLGLVGLVWLCAYQLAWDCTFLDEQPVNQGLLDAAAGGADAETGRQGDKEKGRKGEGEKGRGRKKKKQGVEPPALTAWWERYCKYCDERDRKRTPGTWIIYFSLAALPIFGLGQTRIPAEAIERRQYTFWLMVCYAASALGLLLATQFLGVRRYLRERGVRMPKSIIARWLTLGTLLIAGVLGVAAIVPRPWPEYALMDVGTAGSPDREGGRNTGSGK